MIPEGDASMRNSKDFLDFTNYRACRNLMKITLFAAIDSLVWSALNIFVVFVSFFAYWLWPSIEFIVKAVKGVAYRMGIAYSPKDNATLSPEPLSAVCLRNPTFHSNYCPKWSDLLPLICTATGEPRDSCADFSADLAELLLHISALTYESDEVVSDVVRSWNQSPLDLKYSRFGHESMIMVVLWSVPGRFVIPAFKGTSPFDLTEWITDFSFRKMATKNSLLPGLVHSGFFEVFGFPSKEILTSAMMGRPSPAGSRTDWPKLQPSLQPPRRLEGFDSTPPGRVRNESVNQRIAESASSYAEPGESTDRSVRRGFWLQIEDEFRHIIARFARDESPKPSLIVTGHSLGAGAALLFASLMLWQRTGHPTEAMNIKWDDCFRLEGCMTFGAPRPGDQTWSETINAVRTSQALTPSDQPLFYTYRVINGSDIVCSAPIAPWIDLKLVAGARGPRMPKYISLLDASHYGDPILLHSRRRQGSFKPSAERRERVLGDVVPNVIGYYWTAPSVLCCGSIIEKVIALTKLLILPSLIVDHSPVEYAANLGLPA